MKLVAVKKNRKIPGEEKTEEKLLIRIRINISEEAMSSSRSKRRRIHKELNSLMSQVETLDSRKLVSNSVNPAVPLLDIEDSFDSLEECFEPKSPESSENEISDFEFNNNVDLSSDLRSELKLWAIKHNITGSAVDDLLPLLSRHNPQLPLPKSSKTLLGTANRYKISDITGGKYHHFGLECKIVFYSEFTTFVSEVEQIDLHLGIDGLPISKSSRKQFWPILASSKCLNQNRPFIVGIYFSDLSKPGSVNEFLSPLIEELKCLMRNGIEIKGITRAIIVKCVLCDTPARNFVKSTAAFNGYHGCDRCNQKGFYCGRVTFPMLNAPLRTDEGFKNRLDINHHSDVSLFESLTMGMVSDFVLDYMHVVCLGVMKKLLTCWKTGKIPLRLGRQNISEISERLVALRKYIPSEFNRKPRTLHELDYWKATELRTFLLYLGPFVLKGILDQRRYNHFLKLSLGVRILLGRNKSWYNYGKNHSWRKLLNCTVKNSLFITFTL